MSELTSQRPPADDSANPGRVWFDSIGDIVTPLLAGFAVATLIVVSDDADKLRWPGAAILVLAIATIALIVAVQLAYHGRAWFNEAAVRVSAQAANTRRMAAISVEASRSMQAGAFFCPMDAEDVQVRPRYLASRSRLGYSTSAWVRGEGRPSVGCQLHNIRRVLLRSGVDGKPMETDTLSVAEKSVQEILETTAA